MKKTTNSLRCGIFAASMVLLFGACNSDELADGTDTRASNTDTDSNSNSNTNTNTNTDSNATPGSASATESNSDSLPTGGVSDSDSNDTSNSNATPDTDSSTVSDSDATEPVSTDSQASNTVTDSTVGTVSDTETAGNTEGDTEGDTEGALCKAPPATDECKTCLYNTCQGEYCACNADKSCLCVATCLETVTGKGDGLPDLLGLDLDQILDLDLLNNLLDGLTDQDPQVLEDLGQLLTCVTQMGCGLPLDQDTLDVDFNNLEGLLDFQLQDVLEDTLDVLGNSLAPLAGCTSLLNSDAECGTICPLEESLLTF